MFVSLSVMYSLSRGEALHAAASFSRWSAFAAAFGDLAVGAGRCWLMSSGEVLPGVNRLAWLDIAGVRGQSTSLDPNSTRSISSLIAALRCASSCRDERVQIAEKYCSGYVCAASMNFHLLFKSQNLKSY
jgi:hypothetical protein